LPGIQYSDLMNAVLLRLAGRANAVTTDQLLSAINEGKDELWKALVTTTDDYFLQQTVTTPANGVNLFAALNTTTREYTLPLDCLRPRFIEVISPVGYERTKFFYRKINHSDFTEQRNQSTAAGPAGSTSSFITGTGIYFYTIGGKNTLILARFPEVAFTLRIWYVRALPDGAQGSTLDETVLPFRTDIINFAVKRLSATGKDATAFALWSEAWRSSIINTIQVAGPRSETNLQTSMEAEY
jgi:hypothetical protein